MANLTTIPHDNPTERVGVPRTVDCPPPMPTPRECLCPTHCSLDVPGVPQVDILRAGAPLAIWWHCRILEGTNSCVASSVHGSAMFVGGRHGPTRGQYFTIIWKGSMLMIVAKWPLCQLVVIPHVCSIRQWWCSNKMANLLKISSCPRGSGLSHASRGTHFPKSPDEM